MNTALFGTIARLDLDVFLGHNEFSYKHYLITKPDRMAFEKKIEDYLAKLQDKGVIDPQVYEDENVRVRTLAYNMKRLYELSEEEIQQALEFEYNKLKKRFGEIEE